ncbi:MAG TPA: MFS transporter [Solirubrobacteraceae bacterium]|nr:MFS transporter [Solirubrobacteraceae bacterium]
MGSPLSSPRLRRIITAYTINRLGSWVGLVALSLAVFDHTHSALAVAALLFAWQALPAFLVPGLVARVEASARRSELSALYLFEAVATASLAVLLWHFSLPAVLVLAALDGTAALAASALLRAEVAKVARETAHAHADSSTSPRRSLEAQAQEAERRANAALNIGFSVSFVAGPALGGAVVAAAGAPAALFIDVGSFLICAGLLIDLHPHVEEAGANSARARLNAAWSHINEVAALRKLLLAEVAALIFISAASPIEVTYAKATLHAGDRGYGLLVTSWGAGAVLASIFFARSVRRRLGLMLSAGIFMLGAAFVGFAVAPSLALACVAAVVGGVGNGLEWPSLISLVQRLTPQRLHGRLMGAVESIAALCLAVGLPLGGALVAISSARVAFLILGLVSASATVAFVHLTLTGLEADPQPSLDSPQAAGSQTAPDEARPPAPAAK